MLIFVRTPKWYAPNNYILPNALHFPLCSWRSQQFGFTKWSLNAKTNSVEPSTVAVCTKG